jgi:photosystem II stability/assembly factor-like uncharacterized protein
MVIKINYPIFSLLLCFCISVTVVRAQDWVQQHPNQEVRQMVDIYVSEDGNGWAVGNGIVYHTTDSGGNWEQQSSNIAYPNGSFIFYVEGSSGQKAYMVSGQLKETNDGGVTWGTVDLGENNTSVREMASLSNGNLIMLGNNKILLSTDAGDSWSLVLESVGNLNSLSFVSDLKGWAGTDDGTVYKTTDGGANWILIADTPFTQKVQISFVNENLGFACENKNILRTEDEGQTWELIGENAVSGTPNDFIAASSTHLYATKGFRIYHSVDGGVNWGFGGGVSYSYTSKNIHALPDGSAWVAGSFGAIIYTENPTMGWEDQLAGVKDKLLFIKFFDENVGLSGGGDWALVRTSDAGDTWEDITFPHDDFENFNDALLLSETEFLLGGFGVIYHSINSGDTWAEIPLNGATDVSKFFQTDNGNIFVATRNGKIYSSVDNGTTWSEKFDGDGLSWVNSLYFVNDMVGFASGSFGSILRTDDGGNTWNFQDSGSEADLKDIAFVNENKGFAVINSWSDTILTTIDGGLTWGSLAMPGTAIYKNIYFENEQVGYISTAAAFSGALFKTVDGGETWENIHSASQAFYDIEFRSTDEFDQIWLSGSGGLIEYWTNMVVGTEEQRYEVHTVNVFPNPFDGRNLNINWPNEISERVQMNFYNNLGQLIASQKIKTNQGEIPFGDSLPPGTYYLKLTDNHNKAVYSNIVTVVK